MTVRLAWSSQRQSPSPNSNLRVTTSCSRIEDFRTNSHNKPQKLKQEWFDFWKSKSGTNSGGTIAYADVGSTFDHFYAESRLLPYYNWFEQNFPWQSGIYSLDMHIVTLRPERRFTKSWRFELTDQDVANLRQNNYKILRDACGMTNLPWSYALAKYLPSERSISRKQ